MSAINIDCRKCGASMPSFQKPKVASDIFSYAPMTITAYRCDKCGHWNDLKRRKPKAAK